MKKILLISFSPISSDCRILRHINVLKNHSSLTVAGFGDFQNPEIQYVKIQSAFPSNIAIKLIKAVALLLGCYDWYYWKQRWILEAFAKLKDSDYDLIFANDIGSLPLALKLKNAKTQIHYDAHEYHPLQSNEAFIWRLFFKNYFYYLCKTYMPEADSISTVCQPLVKRYQDEFGLKNIHLITNAPAFQNLNNQLCSDIIRIVHIGAPVSRRKIEKMIHVINKLDDRFIFDIYLTKGNEKYIDFLKSQIIDNNKIKIKDPVPVADICKQINEYDIGFYILEPSNYNNKIALPNKFFDFIQGRLAIVSGPSSEMARLIKQYNIGKVMEDFEVDTAIKIFQDINHEMINKYKQNTNQAAKELNAEANNKEIVKILEKLLVI